MSRYIFKISISILGIFLANCSESKNVDVGRLISDFNLESFGSYKNGRRLENKWFSNDSSTVFTLYENKTTNHFLYLAQNRFRDTIFKFFDSTEYNLKIRTFFKVKDDYFTILWNTPLNSYVGRNPAPNSRNVIYEDLYENDSLSIYLIDSTSNQLKKIHKPSISSIANNFKDTFGIEGNFGSVKSRSKIRLVKDTLRNHKIVYSADVGLEIEKINGNYNLLPYFFNKSIIELDENNFESYEGTFLSSEKLNGLVRYYYAYDSIFDNKGYSRLDFVFRMNGNKQIINTSLENLFDDEEFRKKYVDNKASLIIELFQYTNGEYYLWIYQNLDMRDYLAYPTIYHLDTVNWEIKSLAPYKKHMENSYRELNRKTEIKIYSSVHNSRLGVVLDDFEIVEEGQEYKLLQKEK